MKRRFVGWATETLPRTTAEVGVFVYAGQWQPRRTRCAIAASSGRKRLNLHGAIDLETGMTRIVEAVMVDATSTIALFEALERAYPAMRRIHVFLDNARDHKAVTVREWLARTGCRIVLHFVPPYCPHLNPIERLWGVMHRHVTRNTRYETISEFAQTITDNFRIIDPKNFRIVGRREYIVFSIIEICPA